MGVQSEAQRAQFRLRRSSGSLLAVGHERAVNGLKRQVVDATKSSRPPPPSPPLHPRQQQPPLAVWSETPDDGDFGWYSDTDASSGSDSDSDDCSGSSSSPRRSATASVEEVMRRQASLAADDDNNAASSSAGAGREVLLEAHNKRFVVSTKCFLAPAAGAPAGAGVEPVAFTWAIGGFRVVKEAGPFGAQHAEYQIVASFGEQVWAVWVRFSAFGRFVDVVKHHSHYKKTLKAWARVKREQRMWRCLDVSYLKVKCLLLEDFLRLALFDAGSPAHLLYLLGVHC